MLARHVLGYIPSLLVPALTAFGAIYAYTRLLTPAEFGYYALALNSMTLLNAVFFYWLQVSLPRLMPQAIREGRAKQLRVTVYVAFAGVSLLLVLLACLFIGVVPLGNLYQVAWLAVPLALTRSLLNMNQAFHRSALDFKRYNIIECGQALLGLGAGLALIWFLHMGNAGAVGGLIFGMACMVLYDLRQMLTSSLKDFDRAILKEIVRFGLPLVFTYGLAFIISTSGRFLIEHFQGVGDVGIYAAGYTLMDRINTIIFMMIATPSYPLTVHRLENEGPAAARDQTYHNGVAVLALAMPACAGLILLNHQLAAVLIGSDFRAGALRVMPWIAVSGILNGLSTHYFDHAFHLAKKPYRLIYTQGPTAALNLGLNLFLIPRYGYMGAAYSTLGSYALLLLLSIVVGRRSFPVHFPLKPALQIAAAVALMAAVLVSFTFPADIIGLIAMAVLGGIVYGAALLAFDVMGVRGKVLRRLSF